MLEKKHINPIFESYTYEQIIRKCGVQAEEIAKLLGKKPIKKPKKEEEKGGE